MSRKTIHKTFPGSILGMLLGGFSCVQPALSADSGPESVAIERQLGLMGTDFLLSIEAKNRNFALQASEVALRAVEGTELRLSTWTDDSELAKLNTTLQLRAESGLDSPPAALSPLLARELAQASNWRRETGGTFEPRLGALLLAWDLRGTGHIPHQTEIDAALANKTIWEEGGFGKGAGLDAALLALKDSRATRAKLDLGGQIAVYGPGPFLIDVAHPEHRLTAVLQMSIDQGSVATSGNSERGLMVDGSRIGHLLDPRSGRPAPDFGSLTVWAPSAFAADCLSTALYVMGPDAALLWVQKHPGIEVLVLEKNPSSLKPSALRARASSGLRNHLTTLDANLQVEFQANQP
jgi:FAD:protein FMN transferase